VRAEFLAGGTLLAHHRALLTAIRRSGVTVDTGVSGGTAP
jgi:hypothetical protein